ncbi:MAG TPA: histidinol-phosphate transaminase [Burkholderiales bacterium]|nr:histidinol-phosphate transaminase [Burkholderiales bacterium]
MPIAADLCDLAPSYVDAIAPYQPGKPISELEREFGITGAVKLASNENPAGASPLAIAAAQAALLDVARYPDGNGFELKRALAAHHGVAESTIVLGNGSNDVLELAARTFLAPGAAAVFAQHAFAVYPLVTQAVGASGIEVPARDYGHDLPAMARAITDDVRVVFVANPNNPTGTFVSPREVHAFLESVPSRVLVVLDEAYVEYLPDDLRTDSAAWLAEFPNLVVSHTFSKAHGLAGLRVGYGLAHPLVADLMNRVRQPFNVSSVAQAAAVAALDDQAFVAASRERNRLGMAQIIAGLEGLRLDFIPSYGNFVSFRVRDAAGVYDRLLRLGVIVRPIASYGMPDFLRVSVGLPEENARFLAALAQALGR